MEKEQIKCNDTATVKDISTVWFSENTFKLACRATVGFLLLSVLVFTQKFYHLEYGPLSIIMFLCSITFSSDHLEYGFVSLGCLQSTASLLFGASFGYIAAWLSGSSSVLTVASAAIGTGLFTALHPYQKTSFITSNGEIYFIFNLLDSKKPGGGNVLWNTFYETMIGAILAHITALFVSILIFPKFIHRELFRCLSLSFDHAGTVLSKTATILLEPCSSPKMSSSNSKENKEFVPLQDIQQHWDQAKGYFETTQAMRKCMLFEWNIRYPAYVGGYDNDGVCLDSFLKEWQSFLDTLQALQILVTRGKRRYSDEMLLQWKSFVEWLEIYYAWMASKCHRYSFMSNRIYQNTAKGFMSENNDTKELGETNELSFRFHQAYRQYFEAVSNKRANNLSVFDHGPFMYFIVITNVLKNHLEELDKLIDQMGRTKPRSLWRCLLLQILSTLDVLAWPFYGWLQVLQGVPRDYYEWKALLKNNKFQFFLKKWLVSLSILTFLLASPFYEQFADFNGAWLWLSYILYMQPSTEGTLMNGIANILGVFSACLASALLMLRPYTATNGYLLDSYLAIVTFITVFFLISPISDTLLTFAFTEYVLILYYFNPYEFHETWRYSVTRFLQILLGIIIAVFMNTWILPFSALEETTSCLSSLLEKMVSYYANISNSEYLGDCKIVDQLQWNKMWKEFSYISSVLDSICNGILETTGVSVIPKEILTVLQGEEDLLHRLKSLVIVSRGMPLLTSPFHSTFFSLMNKALSEDWNALLRMMRQVASLVDYKLTHTEAFRCSEYLKDITQQAQKRIADIAHDATMNAMQSATQSLLTGLEKCIDMWSEHSYDDVSPLPSQEETATERVHRLCLNTFVMEQCKLHFPISDNQSQPSENTEDLVSSDWMTPSVSQAFIKALERGKELPEWNDSHRWLEWKRALVSLQHRDGKLERSAFRKSSKRYQSVLLQRMKKLKMNKGRVDGLSQIPKLAHMDYQTFPIIQTTWEDRVRLVIQEWNKLQGILYLHSIYLEWQFLTRGGSFEKTQEPLWDVYRDEYIYWLARMFACVYFMEGLVSLLVELSRG